MLIETDYLDKFSINVFQYKLLKTIQFEEVVLDSQTNKWKQSPDGWCHSFKKNLAKLLQVNQTYLFDMLADLIRKGLVMKNPKNRKLIKTTEFWKNK
jgi:hypothetical protein